MNMRYLYIDKSWLSSRQCSNDRAWIDAYFKSTSFPSIQHY